MVTPTLTIYLDIRELPADECLHNRCITGCLHFYWLRYPFLTRTLTTYLATGELPLIKFITEISEYISCDRENGLPGHGTLLYPEHSQSVLHKNALLIKFITESVGISAVSEEDGLLGLDNLQYPK